MTRSTLTTVALAATVWTTLISFGGIAAETVILYPNIFDDAPASLERAREFLVFSGPNDYYPPLGAVTVLTLLAATVLSWREPRLRWWVAAAAAVFVVCEFLFSAAFFWPRNEIMFVDPLGLHSPAYLRQVAAEFVAGHRVRLVGSAVTAGLVFTALWRRLRSTAAPAGTPEPIGAAR
jgi:hypothetical protein